MQAEARPVVTGASHTQGPCSGQWAPGGQRPRGGRRERSSDSTDRGSPTGSPTDRHQAERSSVKQDRLKAEGSGMARPRFRTSCSLDTCLQAPAQQDVSVPAASPQSKWRAGHGGHSPPPIASHTSRVLRGPLPPAQSPSFTNTFLSTGLETLDTRAASPRPCSSKEPRCALLLRLLRALCSGLCPSASKRDTAAAPSPHMEDSKRGFPFM